MGPRMLCVAGSTPGPYMLYSSLRHSRAQSRPAAEGWTACAAYAMHSMTRHKEMGPCACMRMCLWATAGWNESGLLSRHERAHHIKEQKLHAAHIAWPSMAQISGATEHTCAKPACCPGSLMTSSSTPALVHIMRMSADFDRLRLFMYVPNCSSAAVWPVMRSLGARASSNACTLCQAVEQPEQQQGTVASASLPSMFATLCSSGTCTCILAGSCDRCHA